MKKILLILLVLLRVSAVTAQTDEYRAFIKQAQDFYDKKEYTQAGEAYSKAFVSLGGKGYTDDRYNAACAWSLAGNKDSAFSQLERIATKANFTDYTQLTKDADLTNLYNDKRWDALCTLVKKNKDKAEEFLNKELIATLDTIFANDQDGRNEAERIEKQYGNNSPELKKLWQTINRNDSIDLVKVERIIDKYGWVGPDVVGGRGSQTIFLVIQHADIKTQEHYLPMMREAVKNKKASASSLALLEDRVALREGKKQIYGSQIRSGPGGEKWVSPLEDPDNVDKRRAEVGLGPLAEYIQYWGLKWDVEAYKKQLPEIEKKEK